VSKDSLILVTLLSTDWSNWGKILEWNHSQYGELLMVYTVHWIAVSYNMGWGWMV
jgi:hypothetical protein